MCGFGIRLGFTRAVVQAPLLASRISSVQFHKAVQQSEGIRNLMASYNELLLAQVQQTAACNALHAMESRLTRWLRDRIDSDVLPLTQCFFRQCWEYGGRRLLWLARPLEQAGVIQTRRGRIVVVDRRGLDDVACECYAIVRDQNDRRAALECLVSEDQGAPMIHEISPPLPLLLGRRLPRKIVPNYSEVPPT